MQGLFQKKSVGNPSFFFHYFTRCVRRGERGAESFSPRPRSPLDKSVFLCYNRSIERKPSRREGLVIHMKQRFALLCAGLLLLCLTACRNPSEPPSESEPSTETLLEAETEPSPATSPETASDRETETLPASSEETLSGTDAETPPEAPPETEPRDPNRLCIGELASTAGSYFSRSQHCDTATEQDPEVGHILRLTSADISSVGTVGPETFVSLKNLAASLGMELPSVADYPYVVLKVRTGAVWSRLCSVYGGESIRTAKPKDEAILAHAYLKDTEEWQYVFFDLSALEETLNTLYLRFELAAGKSGETFDIAEIRFLATKEDAVALCGPNAYEPDTAEDTLRIISYNVWVGGGTNTAVRADILRDVIDTYRPDSIGMQEVTLSWKSAFESFVFNESYAGVGEGRSDSYEACLLYYRVDKYELVDSGTFWLSDTPDVKGSSFAEALYPRICTWAHLRNRETGFEYVHINTHLDHLGGGSGGNELRGEQAKVLLEFVNKLGDKPLVMTGDFNTNPSNGKGSLHPAYAYITGYESFTLSDGTALTGPFSDARVNADETVPSDRTATMTKYYEEDGNPSHPPIDYHFYTAKHFHPLSYDTFIFERDGVPLSDHLALICEYRILGDA